MPTREDTETAREDLNGFYKRQHRVLPAVYYSGDLREVTPIEATKILEKNDDAVIYGDSADKRFGYMRFWVKKAGMKLSPELAILKAINKKYSKYINPRAHAPHGKEFRQISPEDAMGYLKNRGPSPEVYGDEGISPDVSEHGFASDEKWYNRFFILKESPARPIESRDIERRPFTGVEDKLVRLINERYGDKIIPRKGLKAKGEQDRYDQYLNWQGSFLTSRQAAERLKAGEKVYGIKDDSGQYVKFYSKAQMRPRIARRPKKMRALKIKKPKKSVSMLDRAMRMVWS